MAIRQENQIKARRHGLIVGLFFVFMSLGLFAFAAGPREGSDRVVIFVPPWSDPTHAVEVIAKADGRLLRMGRTDWIALAQLPPSSLPVSSPEASDIRANDAPPESVITAFIGRLYQSGALFVGNGRAFSACFSDSPV